jgi:hypothetical protein
VRRSVIAAAPGWPRTRTRHGPGARYARRAAQRRLAAPACAAAWLSGWKHGSPDGLVSLDVLGTLATFFVKPEESRAPPSAFGTFPRCAEEGRSKARCSRHFFRSAFRRPAARRKEDQKSAARATSGAPLSASPLRGGRKIESAPLAPLRSCAGGRLG